MPNKVDELEKVGDKTIEAQKVTKGGTYMLKEPQTDMIVRIGRTNDLRRRELEHFRHPDTKHLDFEVDRRTDNYAQQRGREQILYDRYNPPRNKIRPIRPTNQNRQSYLDAAKELE